MLRSLGRVLARRLQRWIPEAFVFAIILTLIVAGLSLLYTDSGVNQVLDHWYQGFWILLEFGMQMILILATGYAIALSPAISRLIDLLSRLAKTPAAVYVLVIFAGGLFVLVSWGWLVLTAVLARELANRVKGIDYAFLVACVYLSSQPWVGGLSSSIPLLLNTEGNFLIETGVLTGTIPITSTLGSPLNMIYLAFMLITVPLLAWFMRPHASGIRTLADMRNDDDSHELDIKAEAEQQILGEGSFSDRMNNSRWLQLVIALAALWYVAAHFVRNGFDINLNIMIFTFLGLGLLVHETPMRYVLAMKRACGNVSGIIFQYPFYAGIMGIMMFSGLGAMISLWMASNASIETLPFIAFLSGALINIAIPSAGGEWAVIGPSLTEAALNLTSHLPPEQAQAFVSRIAMAVAYGETSTNLVQPFYLLIVLPVMGAGVLLHARDVMGYLVIPFLYIFVVTGLMVTFVPL